MGSITGPMPATAARHGSAKIPLIALLALDAGTAGLLLLFIALATPERMNSGIEGAGGGVDDARTVDVDEAPTPPDTVAPAEAGLAPAAKPVTPARAAPAATPPRSPAQTLLTLHRPR